MKFKPLSIGIRLAILSAVISLMTFVVFVVISINSQRENAVQLMQTNTTNMGESFERILRFSMQKNHREEINNAIKSLTKIKNINSVILSDHGGIIDYSTDDALLDKSISKEHQICKGCHIDEANISEKLNMDKQFIYDKDLNKTWTIIPVYNSKSCSETMCHYHEPNEKVLGVIEIVASTSDFENTLLYSYFNQILYSILMAAIIFLALILIFRRFVGKPVKELLKGTKLVAQGNLDYVIHEGEAEFKELSDSFNEMQKKLNRTQQQLILTEKLSSIGKLSAGVAHEINNPLTGILSFSESLFNEANEADPRKEDYKIIMREALRCRSIVKNLLDFTRQEIPILKHESISETILHTLDIVRNQAKFSNIEIVTELSESLPDVIIDAGQISQVLLNLFVNAAEAMPNGGSLKIISKLSKHENFIEIMVSDTGIGIPKADLDKVFEPFFSTKGGKTNGLGLSISGEIIKHHHGEYHVESKVGVGTTFFIKLPIT